LEKSKLPITADSNLADMLMHIPIWWDPVPIDIWARLKVEQQMDILRRQIAIAQMKIKADIDIKNAQLNILATVNKSLG
jgi:hypothetical protein